MNNKKLLIALIISCFLGAANLAIKLWDFNHVKPLDPVIVTMDSNNSWELTRWKPTDLSTVSEFAKENKISEDDVLAAILTNRIEAYSFKFHGSGWMIPKNAKISQLPASKIVLPKMPD